jgi:MFS family permease
MRAAVAEIRAGVEFIVRHPFLRFAVPWAALVNALATGLVLLVIALLKDRGAGPSAIGAITSAAAVGGLLGAVCAPLLARRISGRALVLSASWAVVLASVGVAFAPKPWQIGVIGAALVFLIVPLTVVLETYELRVVPEALLGRVLSARQFAVSSLLWTSTPVAGVLADAFGAGSAVLVLAGCFGVTALWTTASRAVRLVDVDPDPGPDPDVAGADPSDGTDGPTPAP